MGVFDDVFDMPALDVDDAVCHIFEGGVVRDGDDELISFAGDVVKDFQDALARHIVERARGFVAEEKAGILGDGAGDGDALLLAAGELGGEVVHPVLEPHLF